MVSGNGWRFRVVTANPVFRQRSARNWHNRFYEHSWIRPCYGVTSEQNVAENNG